MTHQVARRILIQRSPKKTRRDDSLTQNSVGFNKTQFVIVL